jgi:hypothetical protein
VEELITDREDVPINEEIETTTTTTTKGGFSQSYRILILI